MFVSVNVATPFATDVFESVNLNSDGLPAYARPSPRRAGGQRESERGADERAEQVTANQTSSEST